MFFVTAVLLCKTLCHFQACRPECCCPALAPRLWQSSQAASWIINLTRIRRGSAEKRLKGSSQPGLQPQWGHAASCGPEGAGLSPGDRVMAKGGSSQLCDRKGQGDLECIFSSERSHCILGWVMLRWSRPGSSGVRRAGCQGDARLTEGLTEILFEISCSSGYELGLF